MSDSAGITAPIPPRVLCVDDEPRVLEAIERMLRGKFTVVTAVGAEAALAELQQGPGFAVIMSDLRMPGMNGIALLRKAREYAPDAVRVLLTGHAELDVAIEAVNHGHVFQFLRKPCHPEVVMAALRAAAEQHRLITAERELLEQTLRGSIRALAEVLALVSPAAFGRAERVQRTVVPLARDLSAPDPWSIEVAVTIWHLGCVALSPAIADRIVSGVALDAAEKALVEQLPEAAVRLIAHIPRLESVRALLQAVARAPGDDIPLGAQILRATLDLDTLEAGGLTVAAAFDALDVALAGYDPRVLTELRRLRGVEGASVQVRDMRLSEVSIGMIFANDILNEAGLLLIARGQEVTLPLLHRVRTYWAGFAFSRTVRMILPSTRREASDDATMRGDEVPAVDRAADGAGGAQSTGDGVVSPDGVPDGVGGTTTTTAASRLAWWR